MKSFRTLVSTAALTLAACSLLSSVASAQAVGGSFVLSHEVHWQNAVVPAGTYHFTLESKGPSELLMLHNLGGHRESFMIMVNNVGPFRSSDLSRLVMVSRAGKTFVRTLELPMFETILHFTVPPEGSEKELAMVSDAPVPTHLR